MPAEQQYAVCEGVVGDVPEAGDYQEGNCDAVLPARDSVWAAGDLLRGGAAHGGGYYLLHVLPEEVFGDCAAAVRQRGEVFPPVAPGLRPRLLYLHPPDFPLAFPLRSRRLRRAIVFGPPAPRRELEGMPSGPDGRGGCEDSRHNVIISKTKTYEKRRESEEKTLHSTRDAMFSGYD